MTFVGKTNQWKNMVMLKRLETIANFIGDKKLFYRENKIRKQEFPIAKLGLHF